MFNKFNKKTILVIKQHSNQIKKKNFKWQWQVQLQHILYIQLNTWILYLLSTFYYIFKCIYIFMFCHLNYLY